MNKEAIEKATQILMNIKPRSLFEYRKWKRILGSDLKKIALLRALSPQTKVVNLRSLEYSSDVDDLTADISDEKVEHILRKHNIRFPRQKVKVVKAVRSVDWMKMICSLEELCGGGLTKEREARARIMHEVFGMGWKTTSDFLKDIGFSRQLAVLDSRNLNFLKSVGLTYESLKASMLSNPHVYYELENIENEVADQLGITVSDLDERIMTYTGTSKELPHVI